MSDLIDASTPTPAPAQEAPVSTPAETSAPESAPAENWRASLPETFRENSNIAKYDSMEAFLEGHDNLAKKIGEKAGYQLPGEESDADAWNDLYNKIGRPEAADGYSWEAPHDIDTDTGEKISRFEIDEKLFGDAKAKMHEAGFTDAQFKVAMDLYSDTASDAMDNLVADQQQQNLNAVSELKEEWGDKYDAHLQTAQAAIAKFGLGDELRSLGLGNSAPIMRMFSQLAEKVGESTLTGDRSPSTGGFADTLKALENSEAFKNPLDPGHAAAKARRIELFASKYSS